MYDRVNTVYIMLRCGWIINILDLKGNKSNVGTTARLQLSLEKYFISISIDETISKYIAA